MRFGSGGISNDADVNVSAEADALGGGVVDATEDHLEDASFDFLVAKGCGCDGVSQLYYRTRELV